MCKFGGKGGGLRVWGHKVSKTSWLHFYAQFSTIHYEILYFVAAIQVANPHTVFFFFFFFFFLVRFIETRAINALFIDFVKRL